MLNSSRIIPMDVRMFLITAFCLIGIGGGSLTANRKPAAKCVITKYPAENSCVPSSPTERQEVFCSSFRQKIKSGDPNKFTYRLKITCPEKYSEYFDNYPFGTKDSVEDIQSFIYTVCGWDIDSCLLLASENIIKFGFGFKSATIFDTFYRETSGRRLNDNYLLPTQLGEFKMSHEFDNLSKSLEAFYTSRPSYTSMVNIYDCLGDKRYNVTDILNGLKGFNALQFINTFFTREDFYDECTAVWLYGKYLREERKLGDPSRHVDPGRSTKLQEIFSTLLETFIPKRPSNDEGEEEEEFEEYHQRLTCTKKDYKTLIKQLLTNNYDEETIRFLTQERFLGRICRDGMLRGKYAFKIGQIIEFIKMYGHEKGMELLKAAVDCGLSNRVVELLHYMINDLKSLGASETLMHLMTFTNKITTNGMVRMNTDGEEDNVVGETENLS